MMHPFFSIIIPTFNRANQLKNAINSVQKQEFDSWELIIVDDGSTDDTAEMVRKISNCDNRIKYVYQQNAERSAARNNGISKASGEFICFLDSDDTYSPSHLQELFNENLKTNFQKNIYVVKSKILNANRIEKSVTNIILGQNDYETVLINIITPGQFCMPKEYLQREKFDETLKISEDTEILFRLVRLAKLKVVNQHTLEYIQHEDNSVNPVKYNAYSERYKTLQKIFTYPEAKNVSKRIRRKILSDCFFGISKFYASQEKANLVRWNMLKSILLYPKIRLKEKIFLLIYPKKAL
jgi:glycosyltransferase involved in cell wall biosynthesis